MASSPCSRCGEMLAEATLRCPACGLDAPTEASSIDPAGPSQAPTLPLTLGSANSSPPQRFGHFRLVREIGRGGMGVVYEVEDTKMARRVALKTLFAMEGGKSAAARFLREAQIAGTLDHPNVIAVYDHGTIDSVAYYTMPLVTGLSLDQVIPWLHGEAHEEPPSFLKIPEEPSDRIRLVLEWFEGALEGLEHAHGKGIVHRDLKPSNLLLDEDSGRLRITDFGLARAGHLGGLTRQGTLMGTVGYMSPEHVGRDSDRIERRSDVYSMGVTLYRTLLNRLPHSADTPGAYLGRVASASANLEGTTLPRDLRVILAKSMEKSPADRYQTASEFAEDLARFRRCEPIAARPVGAAGKVVRWSRRRPALAGLSAILVLLAIVLGVVTRSQIAGARVLRAQAVERHVLDGRFASFRRDFDEAARQFDEAIRLDPDHFEVRLLRALVLWEFDDPADLDRGLEDLRVADSLRPELASVPALRSMLLEKRGDGAGAQASREKADAIAPRTALEFWLLGSVALLGEGCTAAVEHFDHAIQRDPQMFQARLERGRCRSEVGDLIGAELDYTVVAALVPDHPFPHNNLANALAGQGKREAAFAEYDKALALALADPLRDPLDTATMHVNYGEELSLAGEELSRAGVESDGLEFFRRAETEFLKALELDPNSSKAHNSLGIALAGLDREGEALESFRKVVEIEDARGEEQDLEDLTYAIFNLCDTHLSLENTTGAKPYCEQALTLAPNDPDAYYNMASFHMKSGNPEVALAFLEKDFVKGDTDYEYLLGDPTFEPLQRSARFEALIARMQSAQDSP